MPIEDTQQKLQDYFVNRLESFGATPKGVDYNGAEAQTTRFEQLVRVVDSVQPFTVIDYGCGYGAMFDFLYAKGWDFEYHGIDLIDEMIKAGRESHQGYQNAHFTTLEHELPPADYLLASAIFNIKLEAPEDEWRKFTLQTLRKMDSLCTKGFSFNMLTNYSDAARMAERPDLFFADPLSYFDFCKRNFSRNVALLHDYGLFDFTIVVRKNV
ncbi:methyltransferase domain-containing protein [Mycobacterium lehmannii]|uniref:methyltransferase domain-containing protein n=1 Tax=Mycobacterium lehmannii TaxID=2048550 RepID=UPI000B94290C|nr:class I SAM-dependent methyltransferase [Mycobacterium lehmannii]